MINYPVKFKPILQKKVWGGNKLRDLFNKDAHSDDIGESWEISGVEGHISIVENGTESGKSLTDLISEFKGEFVGERIYKQFGNEFPLLIKFIDANTDLSVQLHPNDELARKRHNSLGKTEMWFIMQADQGSKLNIGFKEDINTQDYLEHLKNGKIIDLLHFEEVQKGDSILINTGKVHSIGGGILLAEIQQTSDITYRIYDWDRKDSKGNTRDLHTDLALDAIDFELKNDYKLTYAKEDNISSEIISCEYFTTNYLPIKGKIKKDYSKIDSFVIFMCVAGTSSVSFNGNSEILKIGESLLVPACALLVEIEAEQAELLEIYIE